MSISRDGDEGAFRDLKAHDLLVQAETGLSAIAGTGRRRRSTRSPSG